MNDFDGDLEGKDRNFVTALARGLELLGAGVACPVVAGGRVEAREFVADLGEAREFRFSALWRLLRSQRRGVALRR